MGLLDDAIREHLDLKRRRGGDPVEIERAEQEALGPVRRGPEEAPADRAAEAAPPARPVDEHTGQETAEYDVEGQLKRDHDEDVLEETPEFLQDTPEHDRLWFEQRPPRDFDFDG